MSTADLLDRLGVLGERPDQEAIDDVTRALEHAAEAEPSAAAGIDAAVVEALISGSGGARDELLAGIDPELVRGLLGRLARRLRPAVEGALPDRGLRSLAWDALDLLRLPSLLTRIDPARRDEWADSIHELVEASDFTVGPLFRHRAERLGTKTLFELTEDGRRQTLSWRRIADRVERLTRGLLALDPEADPGPVAILSENCLEMALIDLACLTSGVVNVLVPANATDSDVAYVLEHSGARTAVVSGSTQLRKVLPIRDKLPALKQIVTIDPQAARRSEAITLETLEQGAEKVDPERIRARAEAVRVGDLASVMYTSGTTGTPKGIQFSHRNIVFKRFARALALPQLGGNDVFLCFLPLFHTFGRFLELMGCVFLGARYCFQSGTSIESLAQGMRRHRPTAFISVPKKWMQLHEMISQQADPLEATDEELLEATHQVTGGRLKWGLSAAGHLDSDIFRFFQRQGIDLVSGFGMTEATGGITMTEPGGYRDGSLGAPLPGIEARLAEDGELLVRGAYVMIGYLDPPDGEPSFDEDGWFHTGDLMERDESGQLRLIDRKKEIYKNVRGETIAPQRVENLFRDVESVGRAFLVGDHREYNTLLIYPNPDYSELDFATLTPPEISDHFVSMVVSVNQFLAPYERVVDFAVIDRDLSEEQGELTPKGTPRRKVVEKNFSEQIEPLYRRTNLRVGGVELVLPNWLFQSLGITARDIRCADDRLTIPSSGTGLTVRAKSETLAQVGSCLYRHPGGPLSLGALFTAPQLWLGNEELIGFIPLEASARQRVDGEAVRLEWAGRVEPYAPRDEDPKLLEACLARAADLELMEMDLPARMLAAVDSWDAIQAVGLMEAIVEAEDAPMAGVARMLLERVVHSPAAAVRRSAFLVLMPAETEARFKHVLTSFLLRDPEVLDPETNTAMGERDLSESKITAFLEVTQATCMKPDPSAKEVRLAESLLGFLAEYGAAHPTRYRRFRTVLVRLSLFSGLPDIRHGAARAMEWLQAGFRRWLGATAPIAVDPETGREYRWDDVVVFDEAVPHGDRRRMLSAIKRTVFLKEGVFLFSTGADVRLSDIPPGGIWIRLLGSKHGKSVYRLTVQTRFQGSYDLAVNVNHELSPEQVREEIQWLILAGDPSNRAPLVEDFGGYWREQDLWSEEFISGDTLSREMRRLSRRKGQEDRFKQLWPFFCWATMSAYVDFWHRSGKRLEIADPGLGNVIVPPGDYRSGVRIVSISERRTHRGLPEMLGNFHDEIVTPTEQEYPVLRGLVDWKTVFSSVPEVVGEQEGLALFRQLLESRQDFTGQPWVAPLEEFVDEVTAHGFTPMRLHFAIERYRRWSRLSGDATPQARALTLQELYDTYGLEKLAESYPAIRVRFFLETVFRDRAPELAEGLEQMIVRIRDGELEGDEMLEAIDELRGRTSTDPDAEYFLARLSHRYLRPEDSAEFVRGHFRGKHHSEIVVTLEDHDGGLFRIRHAINPKEVERLYRLFLAARLDISFRTPHNYLVAINERDQIIAGIYYKMSEEPDSAHLEKIVVAERYRRRGVAAGLMNQFFNRLRDAGVKTVTTGFFRPEYFYTFGFRIGKRYAGLVKSLEGMENGS